MGVSVVIASYNRRGELEGCLRQLARQDFRAGDEVVVADNASTDGTGEMLQAIREVFPVPLRVVREPRPGKSHAVQAALAASSGDVLAFIDDDVLVEDDWVERIHSIMSAGDADLVGGRVAPILRSRVPAWLDLSSEHGYGRLASPLGLLDYGPERQPLGRRAALGGNLVVRRSAFEAVGGYPRDLGKLRGTLLSGEDHQLCARARAAGFRLWYDPSLRVRHRVERERLRLRYFLRWFFWSGITHVTLDARTSGTAGRRMALYHARELLGASTRAGAAALTGGWTTSVEHATQASFAAGYLWGWLKGARHHRRLAATPGAEAA